MFKRKIGLGQTKLRLDGVDINDETVQGVLEAMKALGGQFPEHIKSITVHEKALVENPKEPWNHTRGQCFRLDDKSRIEIHKGSLIETAKAPVNLISEAKMTTLHEVDHANYGFSRHQTDSYSNDLDIKEQERLAKEFAVNHFMKR